MLVFPNAKINIGLNIVEKRADGFHNIESCFYPVGWKDALEITAAEEFCFESDGIEIPGAQHDNICAKAYKLIADDYAIPAVKIHLLKAIPIGAGLGGGSADASFTIKALNELFELGMGLEKQLSYARRLGSDCAFFILNQPHYCFGKGDQFEDIDVGLAGKWIVMVNPGIHISTVEAYSGIKPKASEIDLRQALRLPVSEWREKVKNDFEVTLFEKYPLLNEIKQDLYTQGAVYAAMSGSGSTIFGIFDQEKDLKASFAQHTIWQGFLS